MRKGFTLIELMIVVVIIGVLSAIAIPKFQNVKDSAQRSACRGNIRTIATTEALYFAMYDCFTSTITNLDPIQQNSSVVRCPTRAAAGAYSLNVISANQYTVTCPAEPAMHGSIDTGISSW